MRRNERGQVATAILAPILGLILLAGIAVAGYQLNWWLRGNAVNRTAKINRTSYDRRGSY